MNRRDFTQRMAGLLAVLGASPALIGEAASDAPSVAAAETTADRALETVFEEQAAILSQPQAIDVRGLWSRDAIAEVFNDRGERVGDVTRARMRIDYPEWDHFADQAHNELRRQYGRRGTINVDMMFDQRCAAIELNDILTVRIPTKTGTLEARGHCVRYMMNAWVGEITTCEIELRMIGAPTIRTTTIGKIKIETGQV